MVDSGVISRPRDFLGFLEFLAARCVNLTKLVLIECKSVTDNVHSPPLSEQSFAGSDTRAFLMSVSFIG